MNYEILRLENISYYERSAAILNNITLNLFSNEILCIFIQDNRERETLCDILTSMKQPRSGRIYIDDQLVDYEHLPNNLSSIYCINETSQFIPMMSVAKNLYITNSNYYTLGITNEKKMASATNGLLKKAGLDRISPSMNVYELTNADRHLLGVAKALQQNSRILVLNNITKEYSAREFTELRNIIQRQKKFGLPIIVIMNKYNELFDIFDRVTLISHGTAIKTLLRGEITKQNLLSHLTTYFVPNKTQSSPIKKPEPFFSARNISMPKYGLNSINFDVAQGEVLGIWDVDWNYSYALADTLFGRIAYTGTYAFNNCTIRINRPSKAIKAGIAVSSSTYYLQSIYYDMDIYENVTMIMGRPMTKIFQLISKRVQQYQTAHVLKSIRASSLIEKYGEEKNLKGIDISDLMKIEVAKWLCINPRLFVFVNPYTYFDDLTITNFCEIIECLKKQNIATIIMHMNKDELMQVCDRIVTLENGISIS